MTAVVICNGPSRKGFDLSLFKDKATTIGCNVVYREHECDYYACIDPGVLEELHENVDKDKIIFAEGEAQFEPAHKPGGRAKNNAGVFAMEQAVKMGKKTVYVLGMDCIVAEGDFLGNVYLNSRNFPDKVSFDDQRRRLFYVDWFCSQYPTTKFIFCFPDEIKRYNRIEAKNVAGLTFSKLKEKLHA